MVHTLPGTSHDLPAFYEQVIAAIRTVDTRTPIMVDAGWYADAGAFDSWSAALSDSLVLYAFHMYEPYEATSAPNLNRHPPYRYPGVTLWYDPRQVTWNRDAVATHVHRALSWASSHGIPRNRVVAGELGCMRQWIDCGTYLNDVLDILDANHVHWAFYSFREDVWEGMDYELAPDVTSAGFYRLMESGKASELRRAPHPLLDIIMRHMTSDTPE